MKESVVLKVNGKSHTLTIDPDTPLLYVLRNQLELNGPKYGCGLQQCGACMVLLDGKAQPSCMITAKSAKVHVITTLEGISEDENSPHPVQEAFVKEQAAQCGYCLNGWIMTSVALLDKTPHPTDSQIREALTGLKCRCGTHVSILRAVKRAAQA